MIKIIKLFLISLPLISSLLLFNVNQTVADIKIVRDSEIEETINLVIDPLKKVSGIKDLKIYLIDDETPNAFTVGGSIIFVHTGLIVRFPDPDVLRGVIAHEIGHILGKHIIRRQQVIDNYTILAMSSAAIGLATAVSSGAPGLAVIIAGQHIAERSVHAYSRSFESSADQMAIQLLEKSHNSTIGMIKFFEEIKIDSKRELINPYDQTHPLGQERLTILKSYNQKSKYSKSQNSEELIYKYRRIAVKLAAYTLELNKIPTKDSNGEEFTNYLKAIKSFRKGSFDDAINYANKLIMKQPKDPYYHELKAQILFESGKKGALEEYILAARIKPNDPLILLGKAVVGITQYQNEPMRLGEFYRNLSFVIEKEPDNLLALYYLAIYYEKKDMKAKSYLNSAVIANKLGNYKEAVALANQALKELEANTPDWYKARDILAENNRNK